MKNNLRTFVAVEMSEAVRDRAEELIGLLRASAVDVKWVARQNMHLTLKFLDEVPLREIPAVCQAVVAAVADSKAFDFEVRSAGAFPNIRRPRTLWLGGGRGREQMIALQERLEKPLAKLGFRKEPRRFEPHLTIGRVRNGGPAMLALGELLRQQADFEAGRTRVAELVVFSSQLGPQGPTYEALSRAPLAR
ncbi:MAG: RNA 2',3'-cyclic phosphodiesterase [Thermoguttaceae bacterium]